MIKDTHKNEPIILFATAKEFDLWLEQNHDKAQCLWVKYAKKGSGIQSITYPEARDTALCWGWIDGLINTIDDKFYTGRYTPRRAKSVWSKVNIGVVERLMKEGRMKPAGLAQVEAAKADGRWEAAYHPASTIEVPEDFQKALEKNPKANEHFQKITKASRYAFLYRLQTAKKPETREKMLTTFIDMLSRGEAYHSVLKKKL